MRAILLTTALTLMSLVAHAEIDKACSGSSLSVRETNGYIISERTDAGFVMFTVTQEPARKIFAEMSNIPEKLNARRYLTKLGRDVTCHRKPIITGISSEVNCSYYYCDIAFSNIKDGELQKF
jgi:hypothetical protein